MDRLTKRCTTAAAGPAPPDDASGPHRDDVEVLRRQQMRGRSADRGAKALWSHTLPTGAGRKGTTLMRGCWPSGGTSRPQRRAALFDRLRSSGKQVGVNGTISQLSPTLLANRVWGLWRLGREDREPHRWRQGLNHRRFVAQTHPTASAVGAPVLLNSSGRDKRFNQKGSAARHRAAHSHRSRKSRGLGPILGASACTVNDRDFAGGEFVQHGGKLARVLKARELAACR